MPVSQISPICSRQALSNLRVDRILLKYPYSHTFKADPPRNQDDRHQAHNTKPERLQIQRVHIIPDETRRMIGTYPFLYTGRKRNN